MDTATAVAGTQAALWHYTDGRTLDTNKNTDGVKALYAHRPARTTSARRRSFHFVAVDHPGDHHCV